MVRGNTRSFLRKVHLYLSLVFGLVFVLLGLTGSALAWIHELDRMLNPDLFYAAPRSGLDANAPAAPTPATVQAVFERLSKDPLYGRPSQFNLPAHAGEVIVASYRNMPVGGKSLFAASVTRQVMIDPYTLRITGERNWGEFGMTRRLLMPTLFHLHRYLLGGEIGKTVIGISGLILIITTFTGLALWWPKHNLKSLRQAVRISFGGSWPRLNYSTHRAVGFFTVPVFLVLGFSGMYFNLPAWVVPMVASIAVVSPADRPANQGTGGPLTPAEAMEAAQARYPQARVSRIALPANASAPYEIRVRQPGEVRKGDGATRVTIDARDGNILRVRDPLRAPGGDVFLNWQFPLHTGEAFGTPGRIFITCFGIMPLLFFITGLVIWLRRRKT